MHLWGARPVCCCAADTRAPLPARAAVATRALWAGSGRSLDGALLRDEAPGSPAALPGHPVEPEQQLQHRAARRGGRSGPSSRGPSTITRAEGLAEGQALELLRPGRVDRARLPAGTASTGTSHCGRQPHARSNRRGCGRRVTRFQDVAGRLRSRYFSPTASDIRFLMRYCNSSLPVVRASRYTQVTMINHVPDALPLTFLGARDQRRADAGI